MKLFKFIAGFFQDQNGESSSKRIALYVILVFLGKLVTGSLDGKEINSDVLYGIFIALFVCLGVITSEFFKGGFGKDVKPPENTEPK